MVSVCAYSQKVNNADFEYPIKPGDTKWEKTSSVAERIASLQIPESRLANIPTERLLDICLDYPYILDVLFCDDYQKGLEALMTEFNGFKELMSREDLGKCVFAKEKVFPKGLNQLQDQDKSEIEKGRFSFKCFVLDLILAQDNVFATLSNNEEQELLDITIRNLELKTEHPDVFSSLNTIPSYLLYAKKALIDSNFKFKDAKQKNDVMEFVQRPTGVDDNIIECVERYIKNK